MKKWTALLPAVLLLISLTACHQEITNPYRIKTKTVDRFLAGEQTSRWKYAYTYDEAGNLSQIIYSLDGKITETDICKTDEYGNLLVYEVYGPWYPATECQDDLPAPITTYTYERISP